MYFESRQIDLAIADYDTAIGLEASFADAYYDKGRICVKLGYNSNGIEAYKFF